MMRLELGLWAVLLLPAPSAAGRRLTRPEPGALLDAALAAPATGYAVRVRVQYFPAPDAPKGQTREVRADADGRMRVESFAKRKTPGMIRVFDGAEETVYAPALKRAWRGPAASGGFDAGARRRHRERLGALYELSVSTGGRVAKRPTWRLELRSKADGRVRRALWLDREAFMVLKREDYRPDGSLRLRERVLRWSAASPGAESFRLDLPAGVKATSRREPYLDCAGAARVRPCSAPGLPTLLPGWLPEGYMLFDISGSSRPSLVTAFMDGQSSASLVIVKPGDEGLSQAGRKRYAAVALKSGTGTLSWGEGSVCLAWRGRDRDAMFCGDLAEDELARVADSLEAAP